MLKKKTLKLRQNHSKASYYSVHYNTGQNFYSSVEHITNLNINLNHYHVFRQVLIFCVFQDIFVGKLITATHHSLVINLNA